MIAKLVKGKGFRGALEYDLQQEKGRILASNMAGTTPRALAAEFGEIRKLRPKLGKAVLHVSLSAAPGEQLTDAQWQEIGQRYLRGMGFTDNQYVITRHTDTEHEHIHILANRITHAGSVVSDGQDYRRQETMVREIERDYGLQVVAPSHEAERRALTKGEIEQAIRTEQPSARQQLQQLCDAAAKGCGSFSEYQQRLAVSGVDIVPVVQLEGAKLSGLSYRLDNVTLKGSDLGKNYTAAGIQKRGISYEQERDREAISRCQERAAHRAFGDPDAGVEIGRNPENGRVSGLARTVGAGDGRLDGRDAADLGRDRAQDQGTGRSIQPATGFAGEALAQSRRTGERRSEQPAERRLQPELDALRDRGDHGDCFGSHRERLLALAGAADDSELTGRGGRGEVSQTRRDRSVEALQKQVAAFGVERVEVGIRDAKSGQMMNREWSRAELEQSAAWLKRMNAKGNDVYVRPAGEHGLVLVDDLKPDALARMRRDGWTPAATIETSPGNYQAWVKLAEKPVDAEVRREVALDLAKAYGGDLNSADSRHYGRLAGFTNQKPQHCRDGRQPYVLAHDCSGVVAKSTERHLEGVKERLDIRMAAKEQKTRLEAITGQARGVYLHEKDPVKDFRRRAKVILDKYGAETDLSRLDWMVAKDMAKAGRSGSEICKAITEASPNIETRKAGHMEDYAQRTVNNVWKMPEVVEARQKLALEQSHQRSHSRGRGFEM